MHPNDMQAAIEEALRGLGRCNVLIAGRTGVGKSTLINSMFHGRMATTGDGRPVTKAARFISKEGVSLGIWDTRGLELADFQETLDELMQLVKGRADDRDPERHIHVAWLCIHEDGRRVQDAERNLCRTLDGHMPVLAVITKARSDQGFRANVQRMLPEARNVVRVRAIPEAFDDGHVLSTMGLDDLVEATASLLPEGIRDAFDHAQKVSRRRKKRQAHRIVASSSALAATAAATPIPFSDAAALVPIQVAMLARISAVYGLNVTTSFVTRLVVSAVGPTAATLGGRAIVANLLKLVPGGGTALGGVIAAATAVTLTTALGELYTATMDAVFTKSDADAPDLGTIEAGFKKRIRTARRSSWLARRRRGLRRWWPFGR